ncbi:hypothetical protein [Nocardia sp. NPDC050718]|uniref:hypothetical protein n=1 Tax=Nocardia sp. NPDC050718 TaxID=3155788 RepID=UPI0034086983
MTPWWQPMLAWGGVIIAAIIAGGIALRNGRKTPHENLKSLVEILDKSQHVWRHDRYILEQAIHREIQRLDKLNKARLEGFWAYNLERIRQSSPWESGNAVALAVIAIVVVLEILS